MANFSIQKVTAVPGTMTPNTVYVVSSGAPYAEIYITDTSGVGRRVINRNDVQSLIDTAILGASKTIIVDTIVDRNNLTPVNAMTVIVINASADPTVVTGSATYVYRSSNSSWIKISESESMDVSLSWSAIVGRPNSAALSIDLAVTNSHTHSNKTQLDQIGQDGSGNLTYNGNLPKIAWETVNW